MTAPLHVEQWGPPPAGGRSLLLVHGLTGHGKRWRRLATGPLADLPVLAPDLRGHGRSTALPPWTLEQHAADLLAVLDAAGVERAVVVGHSFGGAVSTMLARVAPHRVSSVVLLDPAVALDPQFALEAALDWSVPPHFPDRDAALAERRESWPDVVSGAHEDEVADHLVPAPGGGYHWRVSTPAVLTAWSEMTRPAAAPAVPTDLVVADRVDPPFVGPAQLAWAGVTVRHWDCGHVVALERPAETAALVRTAWDRT